MRDIFMLGVQYHMWHALALIVTGWRASQGGGAQRWAALAGPAFILGIVCFCGNLYAFAVTGELPVSGAAPIGGIAFMAGWVLLALSALTKAK